MKKATLLLVFLLLSYTTFAQTGGFNYKALIADNGTALNTQTVTLKFTVLENGTTAVYQETQTAITDANGIVSVNIGEGTVVSGTFSTIDWGTHSHFLKVEIDTGSGFTDFGTSEFKTVPYAKYADKAGNTFSGNFTDLNGVPTGLADGDDVNDADHSTTNELQTLAFDNTSRQLSITNGNSVTIPAGSSSGGDGWGTQVAATNGSINGDGTSGSPLGINTSDAVFNGWDKNASDDFDGNFTHLTNVPSGLADGDDDTQLTDAQITAMGYIKNANDADHDATNELQTLNLSGNQLSILNRNTVTFTGWDTDASDDFSGNYEDLSNTPFRVVGASSTPPSGLSDNMFHTGNILIGSTYNLNNSKLKVENDISVNSQVVSLLIHTKGAGTGNRTGISNNVSGTSTGSIYGLSTSISNSEDGTQTGMKSSLISDGNGDHTGTSNSIGGAGTGQHYGTKNLMYANGTGNNIGVYSRFYNDGNGSQFGTMNQITNTGTGIHIGVYNLINNDGQGKHYGTKNQIDGAGTDSKYGTYNIIASTAGGTHYAVYADAQKTGSYAGYFLGNVAVKDGTEGAGKIFTSDANGKGSWQDISAWDTDASDDVTELNDLTDAKREYKSFYIGQETGQNSVGYASYNVGLGYGALTSTNVGDYNVTVGAGGLKDNTGNKNTAIGAYALQHNKDNSSSVAFGYQAMYYADNRTTGRDTYNTAIGYESLKGSSTPANNTGQYNTAIGYQTLFSNTTGYGNIANGYQALTANTTGFSNVANGYQALTANTTGFINVANGSSALYSNTTGYGNVASGHRALYSNKANSGSVAIGYGAMYYADDRTTGRETYNTAIGYESLSGSSTPANNTGRYNTAIGYQTLISNTTGNQNLAIGYKALSSNTTGSHNVANGSFALYNNVTGNDNTANGFETLKNNTGSHNTATGYRSLYNNTSGNHNTAYGKSTLYRTNTGRDNVAFGYMAGYQNTTGNKNVFLGYNAGYNETGSDKLYIDNSDTNKPLIYGDFNSNELTVNAGLLTINNVGGDADLYINSSGSNNPGVHYYLDNNFKTSTGYSVSNNAYFVYHNGNTYFKNGNILPDGHRTRNLGASGTAWNNIYAHNYVTEGSAAYTDRKVTNEIIAHPPVAKKDGDFDDKSDGLYELNPQSLPKNLHTENGLKIDEIATYNYKANYEQQVQINEQQKQIDLLKKQLETQQKIINQLLKKNQD